MKEQQYKFISYYKYSFTIEGDDGVTYALDGEYCNGGDIYRLSIDREGKMKKIDGVWMIDGLPFIKS